MYNRCNATLKKKNYFEVINTQKPFQNNTAFTTIFEKKNCCIIFDIVYFSLGHFPSL